MIYLNAIEVRTRVSKYSVPFDVIGSNDYFQPQKHVDGLVQDCSGNTAVLYQAIDVITYSYS